MHLIGIYLINLLKNKWFWIVLCAIIVLLIVKRNLHLVKKATQKRDVDYGDGNLSISNSSNKEERKRYLKDLAQKGYVDIYDTPIFESRAYDLWETISDLPDEDLLFLSKHYRQSITRGNSLYKDLNNEYFFYGSVKTKILGRLSKIGENL